MILKPSLSALRPEPSLPAHPAPPRTPGCPALAPKAGRLDPGPLGRAEPLPSSRPRPHPQGLGLPWGSHRPPRVVASETRSFTTRPTAFRDLFPPETPQSGLPAPGWAAVVRHPPPAQEVSVRGQFPPLASAAASLGAAGGGNSLALTLGWKAPALRWRRTERPVAGRRRWGCLCAYVPGFLPSGGPVCPSPGLCVRQ